MKLYTFNNLNYELIENERDAFVEEVVTEKMTDYFNVYDYVVGDWSYGKLRLKGFCRENNKYLNSINDIKTKDQYLKDFCAYGCKYFVLKKVDNGKR